MQVFDFFYNFMLKFIDLISTAPVVYLVYTLITLWVFTLFFKIARN